MAASPQFLEHLLDALTPFGGASPRKMFGGHGVFRDGVMIGLIADDVFYLKVDDRNRPDFEAAGTGPFVYEARGKTAEMSYYEVPADVMEDPDELAVWARKALDAALAAKSKGGKKSKKNGA